MMRLLAPSTAERTRAAVKAFEQRTAVELVVAVRPGVGGAAPSLLLGWLLTTLATGVLLFVPVDVPLVPFFVAVVLAGLLGVGAGFLRPVRRWWLGAHARAVVADAARAAFVDLGVHHTAGRTGLLVFVAAHERLVEFVGDRAVPPLSAELVGPIAAAVACDDVDGFLVGLQALAEPLGRALPRAADDVNELDDGPAPA
jgi:putative membrane protein